LTVTVFSTTAGSRAWRTVAGSMGWFFSIEL
jgi:hypothetical protein